MALTPTMSIGELRDLVRPLDELERIHVDPTAQDVRFERDDAGKIRFAIGQRRFAVRPEAYLQLGQIVGVPQGYAKKTPHDLILPHVNYWLQSSNVHDISFAVAGDAPIDAFGRGASDPYPNGRIVDLIEDAVGYDLEVHHVAHLPTYTTFSIVTRDDHPVEVGDIVRAGVTVQNSMNGAKPITLAAYQHRLVCMNGAVSAETVYQASKKPGDGFDDWLHDAIRDVFGAAEYEVDKTRGMLGQTFDGRLSDSLDSIFDEFGVPRVAQEPIRNLVINRGVHSLYDLYNVVTDVASHNAEVGADPQTAIRLMGVGGQMMAHPQFCTLCHRILH